MLHRTRRYVKKACLVPKLPFSHGSFLLMGRERKKIILPGFRDRLLFWY